MRSIIRSHGLFGPILSSANRLRYVNSAWFTMVVVSDGFLHTREQRLRYHGASSTHTMSNHPGPVRAGGRTSAPINYSFVGSIDTTPMSCGRFDGTSFQLRSNPYLVVKADGVQEAAREHVWPTFWLANERGAGRCCWIWLVAMVTNHDVDGCADETSGWDTSVLHLAGGFCVAWECGGGCWAVDWDKWPATWKVQRVPHVWLIILTPPRSLTPPWKPRSPQQYNLTTLVGS